MLEQSPSRGLYDCHVTNEVAYDYTRWRAAVRYYERYEDSIAAWPEPRYKVVYTGPARRTAAEAAEDAREWCRRKGISYYHGPITSGAIG